jgi:hypothetical protein
MTSRELAEARRLVRAARIEFGPRTPWDGELAACERRLDEPLRVALTGTLKAGKSTLLNALIGDEIAPTDATECTRVVTWFQRATGPRIELTAGGTRRQLPVLRTDGHLTLELGVPADRVERLAVFWPSSLLDDFTVIDTPGTSSNSRDVSERTLRLLAPEEGACEADAVVYLMRDLRDNDVNLLQQIHDRMASGLGPLGIIGVLSRADEVEGGRGDSLAPAQRISEEIAIAPELAGLHQNFIPVSGLLALRGQTLRQSEFAALRALAAVGQPELESALISVARFSSPDRDLPIPAAERAHLTMAFGLFGIRLAVTMIRSGAAPDAPALAAELLRRSGLDDLRRTLTVQFGERNEQLKAQSTLQALKRVLHRHPTATTRKLSQYIDRLLADTHTFTELRLLSNIHATQLNPADRDRAIRVLGGQGISVRRRLGLAPDADAAKQLTTARQAIHYWRDQLDNPLLDPTTAATCRAAARSCEAIVADLSM